MKAREGLYKALGALKRSWKASSPYQVAFRAWLACWGPLIGIWTYEAAVSPKPDWGFRANYGLGIYFLVNVSYLAWYLCGEFDNLRFWKNNQAKWEALTSRQQDLIQELIAENYALKSGLGSPMEIKVTILN